MSFDYSSGNPDNLTGGNSAAMVDIQGSFYDIRAYLNSGALQTLAQGLLVVGEVRFIAVPTAPALWLPCDGAAISRTTYSKLFTALGTTYGAGDGTNTFNVPDLRDRTTVGAGTTHAAGSKFGEETHVLTIPELAQHNHGGTGNDAPDHSHSGGTDSQGAHAHYTVSSGQIVIASATWTSASSLGGSGAVPIPTAGINQYQFTTTDGSHSHNVSVGGASTRHSHTIANAGTNTGHNNVQPSLAVPAYIYAGA